MKRKLLHIVTLLILIASSCIYNTAFAQTKKILVCGAASSDFWNEDVRLKIQNTGLFLQVDKFDVRTSTPSLATLQLYDAVLVFSDAGFANSVTFGDNLADYIDAGGAVVSAVFNNASVPVSGNYNSETYLVIVSSSQTQGVRRTLGTIHFPSHPTVRGITNFDGGTSSYTSSSTTLTPGSYRVADFDNGDFLVVAKDNVGPVHTKRVDLNLYPPSNDVRGDFWVSSSDGARLMANALLYVSNLSTSVESANLCVGAPLQVKYTVRKIHNSGNTFTAQLSDASGNFASPVNIGSISSVTSGTIEATIPVGIIPGNGYRIRVVSSDRAEIGMDNGNDLIIGVAPAVTINGTSGICLDGTLSLSTNAVSGATYTWTGPNGFTAATQDIIINNVTSANAGDYTLSVSNNGCSSIATTSVVVNELPAVPVITAGSATTFCEGGAVTLSTTAANGYQWYKNGMPISEATNQSYIANSTGNYTVEVMNASGCKSISAATSVTVNPLVIPSVSIGASTATTILLNTSVTFTATPDNGGTAPVYQWKKNGIDIDGANTATYTTSSLANNDRISFVLTSNATCATPASVSSNEMTITVLPPTITLNGSLSNFNQIIGSVSATQNFNVSGTNLVGNVTISAPAGYQLSLNGTTWNNTITLSPSGNSVAATQVSVRLNAIAAGAYTGNIAIASTGTSKNIAVSGTAVLPTLTINGTPATFFQIIGSVSASQAISLNGANLLANMIVTAPAGYELSLNGTTWNNSLTLVPVNNAVATTTVFIRLNSAATGTHAGDISITSTGAASKSVSVSGTSVLPVVTVNGALSNLTQVIGFVSPAQTFTVGGTNLLNNITVTAPTGYELSTNGSSWSSSLTLSPANNTVATSTISVRLNASTAKNYVGDISITSSGAASASIPVSGVALPTPVITLNGSAMDFTQNMGTPSFTRSYQISGANLLDNVTLTPPAGFELSLDGKVWYDNKKPLTLLQQIGSLAATTIYVRLNSQEAKSFSGLIANATSYAAAANLSVTGINYMALKVSPNPVSAGTSQITVWHPQLYTVATLTVYNLNGVKLATYNSQPRSTSTSINVQQLPAGAYFIEFRRLDVKQVFKFIKQ